MTLTIGWLPVLGALSDRAGGFFLAYALLAVLFGGFTLVVSTWLIEAPATMRRQVWGWHSPAGADWSP